MQTRLASMPAEDTKLCEKIESTIDQLKELKAGLSDDTPRLITEQDLDNIIGVLKRSAESSKTILDKFYTMAISHKTKADTVR